MVDVGEKLGKLHLEDYSSRDYDAAEKIQQPVMIGKVDCVTHQDVCSEHSIRAYPTLMLFHDGKRWKGGEYNGHRNLLSMVEWLYFVEEQVAKENGRTKEYQILQHVHKGMMRLSEFGIFRKC
jgi:hypothetical protein